MQKLETSQLISQHPPVQPVADDVRGEELKRLLRALDADPTIMSTIDDRAKIASEEVRRVLHGLGYYSPRHTSVISTLACKGGVGKTTLTAFTALRLASYGARVLLLDSDPQANLTALVRRLKGHPDTIEETPTLVHLLGKRAEFDDLLEELDEHVHLLPSNILNSLLERELLTSPKGSLQRLDRALREFKRRYDFVFIDCAPGLNVFNASAVMASDLVLTPFRLDQFCVMGLRQTVEEIRGLAQRYRIEVRAKAVLNSYRELTEKTAQYLQQVDQSFGDLLASAVIRHSLDFERSQEQEGNLLLSRRSRAFKDIDKLAIEIFADSNGVGKTYARYQ